MPVLIITGANDPATPPASARAAASRLGNVRVIIVPEGGHGLNGLVGIECIEQITERFLATADPDGLDAGCVADIYRKPFILDSDELP